MLNIHIATATDSKGNIVVWERGATFSKDQLKRIRAPHTYELWASRGYEPITTVHAKDTASAREYIKAKYRTRGLSLIKVTTRRRRV